MFILNCNGKLLTLNRPLVMGIINATPDSFYSGSRVSGLSEILQQAEKMIGEGADIIDIGGQSTRPGSEKVSATDELDRVIGGVNAICRKFPEVIISIDTYHSSVARKCVETGARMVNDVSGGELDPEMLATVAGLKVPYIAMHMKGTPQTMQQQASYENVTMEVFDFFIRKKEECKKAGIRDVILDPGFGFAKNTEHNFTLLKNLSLFTLLQAPLLFGMSRKSSVYRSLNIPVEESLNGTTVLDTMALMNGANILRVHDVKEAREAVQLYEMVSGQV